MASGSTKAWKEQGGRRAGRNGKEPNRKTMTVRRIITLITVAVLAGTNALAQDDVEYRWEVGAGVGMMTYMGDFNGKLLSADNTSVAASVVVRRTFNPYSHLGLSLGYGSIKGKSNNEDTFYPDFNTAQYKESARTNYSFSNPLFDLNAVYEYNFFPYGTGKEYRGAQRFTPFIAIGLGFTFADCKSGVYDASDNTQNVEHVGDTFGSHETGNGNAFTVNIPVGVGVKYKIGERTNAALEWLCHFSGSDKLDGVRDPYRINTGSLFKNTDCYSTLQVSVTYSFGPKCKTCMNSEW